MEGKAEAAVKDEVMVVGAMEEDEVMDMHATTIIYLMISIGTLINLPTINWSKIVSLVVNYNLTMWIAKPCHLLHPHHHLFSPPAVTTTIPASSDVPSALTTPTHQVNTAHVTPSTGGSSSAQMDSGPSTLLCQMMSSASARSQPSATDGSITTTFRGHQYNVHRINHTSYRYSYDIHENCIQSTHGALVDSGANGGMAGPDTCVLSIVSNVHVDITGISGSPIEQLPLAQCAAVVDTLDEGKVILIMSQYAHSPQGKTI